MHFSPLKFMVLFTLLMFSDFYLFGRSIDRRRNFKNHLKFLWWILSSLYSEKMNKIMLLF